MALSFLGTEQIEFRIFIILNSLTWTNLMQNVGIVLTIQW